MRLQDFTSSRPVTRLGLFLARVLPPRPGYGLATLIARAVAARRPAIYRVVCANLRQIVGPDVPPAIIDDLAFRLFRHTIETQYDFFRAQGSSPEALAVQMPIPPAFLEGINSARSAGQGVLLLGMHMSNFDLAMQSFAAHGLPVQALSVAEPPAGFQLLNELRERAGFEVTPISPESLRQAVRRLRKGGIVLTGVDRPVADDRFLVPFFDRPAYLPLGPARLARLTGAAVFLGACHHVPEVGYKSEVIGPLPLQHSDDRSADIEANTRLFATFMEAQIRPRPEQWLMFHPFWPSAAEMANE